ncbi:hypothetical protein [Paraburkholderia atlantica]|uniref:hypothetical protein n=1 Tax=Paraburkholderia atlantica TaxID=2654982 RepID=UPI00036BB7B5|nr:hypothetical protein [Paraburkholderia atlantica]
MKRSLPIAVAFFTIILLFLRAPDRILHGFLWAEDASLFIAGAYISGIHAVFLAYGGYLHLIPRLIALVQHAFIPITLAPYFFMGCSVALSATSSIYIFSAVRRFTWVRWPNACSIAVALIPWLAPQSGEVFVNITNLQWVMTPAFMVLLWESLATPRLAEVSRTGYAIRIVAVILLGLTGPFGVFAGIPAAIGMAMKWKELNLRKLKFFGAYAVTGLVQIWVYVHHREAIPGNSLVWAHEWAVHLIGGIFMRASVTDRLPAVTSILAVCVVAFFSVMVENKRSCWITLGLLFVAMLAWLGGMLRTPGPPLAWDGAASRYTYLTNTFVMWMFVIAFGTTNMRVMKGAAIALGLTALVNSGRYFRVEDAIRWQISDDQSGYMLYTEPGWKTIVPANH